MKQNFILFASLLSLFSFAQVAHAQGLEEILFRHFDAVGQRELLKKQTYSSQATIDQMGMQIPMSMKVKRPNKFRMEMEMQGQKMVQAYDGKKGWMIAPWISQKPRELTGTDLNQAMEQANLDGELYNYKEKGKDLSLEGKVDIEGKPMYNIKLNDMDGSVKNYYIDAEDFLIKKVTMHMKEQGQEVEVEQNISEYKNVDGVMMPAKIESKNPMGTAIVTFTDISFNDKIDDTEFQMPE